MADKPDPRIREIRVVGDIRVFLVTGRVVRDHWYLDFTQGGNDQAYDWFPKNEIWVDDANVDEADFILLHELHEHSIMRELGIGYERAHQAANEVEQEARRNCTKLPELLSKEIRRSLRTQKMLAQDEKPMKFSPRPIGDEFQGKDAKGHAAGVLFVAPDGDVLTLRRSGEEANFAGHWALPGGGAEDGETPEDTAKREAREEMGEAIPNGPMKKLDSRMTPTGMAFHTFVQPVGSKFVPKLNSEHSGYAWAPMHELPAPLHPGVSATLSERLLDGKTSADMSPEDWTGMREGFLKWTREEEQEQEHASDAHGLEDNVVVSVKQDPKRNNSWVVVVNGSVPGDSRAFLTKQQAIEQAKSQFGPRWWPQERVKFVFDEQAMDSKIALDRDSVRSYDKDGRMHVAVTAISKANICPYYGREIPNAEALGLDPDKVYKLLRDPEELKKAASTFNNLPLLSRHVPVTADSHNPDIVVGSTGTDADFQDPYLVNSLVLWTRDAIDSVEGGSKKELSCAYHYTPDMTPGTFKGEAYDGVMRDLIGNHVATVPAGRAGSDVVVGDSALTPRYDFAPFKPISFRGFKPDHIAFDAFTPAKDAEGQVAKFQKELAYWKAQRAKGKDLGNVEAEISKYERLIEKEQKAGAKDAEVIKFKVNLRDREGEGTQNKSVYVSGPGMTSRDALREAEAQNPGWGAKSVTRMSSI